MERQLSPEQDALEHIVNLRDKPFLEERFIDSFKGRGVFTLKPIEPSTFVVEYRGNIFSHKDTRPENRHGDSLNGFSYRFSWNGAQWCVDASKEDRSLGRLVNDDHMSPNCEMKKIICQGKPHLCLFAVEKISPGEEITFNYGDFSYPWRPRESCDGPSTSNTDFYPTSSTPRNKRVADSAASSPERSCSDDDNELPGPSNDDHSSANIDSCASSNEWDVESSLSSDERDSDEDYVLPDSRPKKKGTPLTGRNYCFVCRKGVYKIGRHFLKHMDDVPEITETFAFPAKSPERKRLLNVLRNRGNYEHNQEVMRNNNGELKLMRRPNAKLRIRASSTQQEHESSLSSDEHDSDGNYKSDAQDQDPTFTSKNYCYVCGKGVHKIARHFLTHIDDEPEIAEACSLPVRSPERSRLLDRLRNRGNYEHNQEVMRNNSGELKLKKRPNAAMAGVEKYGHCPHCKGMFNRVDLWRHVPRCGQKMSATCGKTGVLNEVSLGSRCPQKSSGVWQMLLSMRQDNVALVVQNDGLLMQLAQSLYKKHGNNPTKQEYSRQKLREMGRLLLTLHEKLIFSSEDAIKLKNFCSVVDAVKKIACFDGENKSYRKPNLALRLGYSLKALGNIVINGADSSAEMVSDAKKFMALCDEEWTELSGQKAKGPATIPFTRDVQAFYRYLEKESASATESMKTSENPQVYKILCRVTLAQACVLNRCPLEVSRMTLKSFQERGDTTRVLSKHFIRINIAKKIGQSVAVLLTSQLVAALTLLVSKRLICGVHEDNPFLFAKPNMSSTSLYNGGNCVRDFSSLCCAQNPEYLRSMNLHKHMARIFQILNLENDELDHLAKLLGHDIRTDRDYYRLPEAAVELAKIAKLLVAMEKGSLERFKGNSLDEIEIEDELELDLEKGNAENNTEESDRTQRSGDVEQGTRLTPQQDALQHIKARRDKHFLEEKFIDSLKGKGVFTRQSIEPSTFVVEYRGNILTHKEMQKCGDTSNTFMFDFRWKGTNWCIDASTEVGSLGRLVNEDHTNPNCEMKKIVYKGKPHLCLFALKKISPDEEITFNYKESRVKESAEASSCVESDSDEDYVCDDQPNSNDGFNSDDNQNEQDFKASSNQLEDESDHSSDFDSDSDEESTKGCTFTKKNYCYVCGRAQSKISRHLLTHRGEEPDIAQVLKLRRNSKERKILLEKLRNRGNYKHNQEVLRTRSEELKVRRTSEMIKTFATCIYCKAMYGRKELWRHMQKCPSKRFSNPPAGGRTQILTLIAATGLTDPDQLSPGVRNMLKKLKKDEIGSVVWEDPYILQLAQCLYYINEEKQRDSYINQSLRQMARLLMTLRKKSIGSFEEAIKPSNFSSVVEAVRELAGFNQETKVCDKRTVIWKMGYLVKKIADIKYGRTLKDEKADQETIQAAETFVKLCAKEWPTNTPAQLKIARPPTILFTQDVQLLHQCVVKTVASAVQSLTLYQSAPVYNALLRPTLAYVTILNRNVKELSKVTLQSFQERDETQPQEKAADPQSQFEQILSKQTVKINVVSNGGKKILLTLTRELLSAITLLVSKRLESGVHENNPFLFARPVPTCTSHCQGQNCVNTFVSRCNAKNQESLRSAFFRKQILNICQILCLADDELDQLAKVLGRDIRTESEYYQTPEAAADIAKISMLLTAMESGCLEVFEGKSLEEIEIPDGVEPVVEHEAAENSDAGEDIEESETGRSAAKKKSRVSSSRQSGRGRKKTQERENEQTELNNEENNNTINNTETEDKSEDGPGKCEEATPEETRSEVNKTSVYFSDDGDANEDFGVDVDTDDEVKNDESDLNLIAGGNDASSNQQLVDGDHEENMEEKESEKEDDADEDDADEAEDDWMDTSDSSSSVNTEKNNNVSSALSRMKEVKIFLPKMDIEKLQTPVHVSQLSSLDIKLPVKDQLISEDDKSDTPPTPPTEPTQPTEEPSCPKSANMTCSHCKKTMMKGHTAYQKKGFPDVFCSKSCLFQMFLHNKPPVRTCHRCLKVISQTLDLIMAAVDSKGTMKDFCSVACLCSFKCPNSVSTQTPRPLCSMCSKSCTTTRELTLNATVHKFCSDVCLEGFCKGNFGVCENCSSTCCREPLTLKLEDAAKTVCCEECLDEYKERITTTHQCTMCHVCRPVSDMFYYKTLEGSVRLFCSRHCVSSHKLRPTVTPNIQGNKTTEVTNGASAATEPVSIEKHLGDSYVVCSECGKTVQRGQTLYQPENALQIYCSASCFSQSHPNVRLNTKKCHNCFQVITRPHNIIRAPVDDSGMVKELCSDTCLSSVKARMKVSYSRPRPQVEKMCKMCSRSSLCEFKLTLDGVVHGLCSESCVTHYYHKVNNLPLPRCDVCSSLCLDRRLVVKMEDGCKTVCSDRCLVMFKEKVETRQLCLTCQTFHHMSDMIENQNKEGMLDFFCSNRCMLVFAAPSFTVSETKSLSSDGMKDKDETDSKEVKPLLPKLKCIKEEPVDEFCIQTVSASTVPDDIKHEVNVAKVECTEEEEEEEEVKTGPVFCLTGDSTSTETSTAYTGLPASCTGCRKDLMDEDTVYQRKDHTDIFCSTSCLFKFCQAKPSTCNFCLREIMEPKDALKSAVANEKTKKVFCSQPCPSSFNYKEMASTKMPIVLLSSHSRCSMCSRYCISKQEIIQQGAVHKICSDQCFFRFCNLNNLSVCENCHSYCDKSLTVRTEGGHKMVCGAECLTQFKQKIRTPQPCAMCRSSKLMSDMVENKNSEDVVEFFCTSSCAMASKVRTASGASLNCDNCDNLTVPACHLAMTDASIRNFCSLSCAMTFKEKKDVITASNEASDQTDVHKPAEKLLCALCESVIRVTPRVIQNQEKTTFVCSLTCCHEYKIVNNITGPCEHCKNERIVRDVKRIDGKDRRFCSEGCKTQYRYELEKTWGGACRPCAYCFCISRIVVTARDEPANKEFCSEVCCTNYKKLVGRETKCDACGLRGDLKKSLSLLGGVKHFCDLKCLLHFCVKKVRVVDEADDTSGSFPVIVNVVSLAGALAERLKSKKVAAERKKESVADVKTKVVEQKVTKELKNKAVLCAPLVHNKGVSCSDQSLETEKRAVSAEHGDKTSPQVIVLPVPVPVLVPVYVPVPMNMYSQYTPKPVGLPLPLPVPMFLPEKTSDSEPTITALDERMNPEGNKREDEHVTEDKEAQESLKNRDRSTPPQPELPPPPLDMKSVASPLLQQAVGKVHNKNKLNKSEEESSQRSISQDLVPKMPQKLETQCGVDAWRRWIQRRESQTNMGHVSSHAVTFKEDVLSCSTAELSDGLCLFIHEAKLPDGESYSPDGLFHLCLSIQQYLFDNGRFENIFSDLVYSRFTTEFTNILRHLKHPVTASGYIQSRVEEEFLWDCKQLGAYSPIVLLNTLLFFCSKYFGFTTVEQHRQLSFSHLKLCTRTNQNNTNATFLRFHPPTSLNETDADGVPAKRRKRNEDEDSFLEMMENRQNPLRCPVRLYEFYLSKCPDSVRQRSDVFYLHPDRRCVPSSHLWFSPTPLDASSMEAMIVRILAVRELQKTDEGTCVDLHSE